MATFTDRVTGKINEFPVGFNDDTGKLLNAEDYIRTFFEGLYTLFQKCGYQGPMEKNPMLKFIVKNKSGVKFTESERKNIKNWIDGAIPSQNGTVYKVCFALHASYEQVVWFFDHVCFMRPFNLHSIKEVIYDFCFRKNLSYEKSEELLEEVSRMQQDTDQAEIPEDTYTNVNVIRNLSDEKELLEYLKMNLGFYTKVADNRRAYAKYKELKQRILCEDEGKNLVIEDMYHYNLEVIKKAGEDQLPKSILLRDLWEELEKDKKGLEDKVSHKELFSNNFLLNHIYGVDFRKTKAILPFAQALPTSKDLSNLDHEKSDSKLRNTLILLEFYDFAYHVDHSMEEVSPKQQMKNFICQTGEMLEDCGWNGISVTNPYDQVFIRCAGSEESPIEVLRQWIREQSAEDFYG